MACVRMAIRLRLTDLCWELSMAQLILAIGSRESYEGLGRIDTRGLNDKEVCLKDYLQYT